jgi:hypothetical protein
MNVTSASCHEHMGLAVDADKRFECHRTRLTGPLAVSEENLSVFSALPSICQGQQTDS